MKQIILAIFRMQTILIQKIIMQSRIGILIHLGNNFEINFNKRLREKFLKKETSGFWALERPTLHVFMVIE